MPREDIVARENRIKALTQVAAELLKEGKSEAEVKLRLEELVLRNWGVSINTLVNYVKVAMAKAKAQVESAAP